MSGRVLPTAEDTVTTELSPSLPGVLDTPGNRKVVSEWAEGEQTHTLRAITNGQLEPVQGLEAYGLKFRKLGVIVFSMILDLTSTKGIGDSVKMLIPIWALACERDDLHKGSELMHTKGVAAFTMMIEDWYEKSKIPTEVTREVNDRIAATVKNIFGQASETTSQEVEIKKNATTGP